MKTLRSTAPRFGHRPARSYSRRITTTSTAIPSNASTVFFNLWPSIGMYVYQPDGSPLAAGKPTISTISTNGDGSLHLTGLLFNGISEGAAYGDDHQMDGNFPLVRFTDATGHVRYGRTFNWSSTGVMTGGGATSTECWAPPGSSAQDTIQVVANGIASAGVSLNPVVTTLGDSGAGSLRQAISNSVSGSRITFAAGLSTQTIMLTSGELKLSNSMTIDASALAAGIQINGNHNSRIFDVASGVSVTLNMLTITNGYITGSGNVGGAIQVQSGGTLSLNSCTLTGNSIGSTSLGGAIYNNGTLTLTACTLAGNMSTDGGGIENVSTATLVNCTLANNAATADGGAIENYTGQLTLKQCTLSGNSSGNADGGFDSIAGNVDVVNTIVANNGGDIYYQGGMLTFDGTNIVTLVNHAGGSEIINGGVISANPLLGPLANNGGPTLTMLPGIGSPAIDAGATSAAAGITDDQRGPGFPRVAGAAVDIGAVELPLPVTVSTTSDSGYGSLRYAATYAPNNSTITFTPALAGQTITLTSGEILFNQGNYTIDASSLSSPVQVNSGQNSRLFELGPATSVTLNSLVLTNGFAGSGNSGGAIQVQGGSSLSLNNCTISGNSTDSGDVGGAINNNGVLVATSCTFADNVAVFGGAIENSTFNCSLVNCTLANNIATADGGGIDNGGHLTLKQCTLSGNSSGSDDGGFDNFGGTVDLVNTIVANNGGDIYSGGGILTFDGTNIVTSIDNSGSSQVFNGGIISADPLLGPLANNGGPTLTMMPQSGSPAINAGLTSAASGITYDQRGPGFPRVAGTAIDIGAVEVQSVRVNTPFLITGDHLTNGIFGFSFTNVSGTSFTIFATTNISLPLSNWSNLGSAVESPLGSGQFRFTDSQAGNSVQRFYIVRSP